MKEELPALTLAKTMWEQYKPASVAWILLADNNGNPESVSDLDLDGVPTGAEFRVFAYGFPVAGIFMPPGYEAEWGVWDALGDPMGPDGGTKVKLHSGFTPIPPEHCMGALKWRKAQ